MIAGSDWQVACFGSLVGALAGIIVGFALNHWSKARPEFEEQYWILARKLADLYNQLPDDDSRENLWYIFSNYSHLSRERQKILRDTAQGFLEAPQQYNRHG
ncbi:MAG: hypothetical protein AB1791_01160 [Chloroflexota bacterium]